MSVAGTERARLESAIARSHRAVHYALRHAEAFGDEGIEEDLRGMLRQLLAIQEELLGGRRGRTPLRGQLTLPGA